MPQKQRPRVARRLVLSGCTRSRRMCWNCDFVIAIPHSGYAKMTIDRKGPSLCGLQLLETGQHFLAVTLRIDLEIHLSDHARGVDQEGVACSKNHAVVFHD